MIVVCGEALIKSLSFQTIMSGSNLHKTRYKNVGLDSQEMRRRREEEGIQLRKQKREQQLFKKRNVHAEDPLQVRRLKD